MTLITQSRLKELLHYDPITGIFTWIAPTSRRVKVGDVAGTINRKGYRIIKLDGRLYRAHRLAWLYVNGVWPPLDVDHIDKVKDHNWIKNLRPATNQQNHGNRGANKNSALGVKGVSMSRGKFRAQITVHGKKTHLGRFDTLELAAEAYAKAARAVFGEFAST